MLIMQVVRKKHPSAQEIDALRPNIDDFVAYQATHFAHSFSHYLHVLRDHIADKAEYVFNRWGIGLGFYCTQSSEHGNKLVKTALRHLSGHTKKTKNKFDYHMRDRYVRLFHFLDTVRPVKDVKDICSRCGRRGHRKSNKHCPGLLGGLGDGGGLEDAEEEEQQ